MAETKQPPERAIQPIPYLVRINPYWSTYGWMSGEIWRAIVRAQPLAIDCRQALVDDLMSLETAIVPKNPEEGISKYKREIQYYTEVLIEDLEADKEKIAQDALDIPFGGMYEVGREGDQPDGRIMWVHHVDGATLYPTLMDETPIVQIINDVRPTYYSYFPKWTVERIMYTPRPEFKRQGWGMAPPEKIYLTLKMLSQGDTYYAGLLSDTPEAGILDLIDMSEEDATAWLDGFRTVFSGIDGFKIPVLYQHSTAAKWIPFGRSPTELLMDTTTTKYAQLMCAGYGLRLSDLGMESAGGERTLAGVIRGERQSKRSGYSTLRTKYTRLMNRMLRETDLKFIIIDNDSEDSLMRNRAILVSGQALVTLREGGLISQEEARKQLIEDGQLTIELDPDKLPDDPLEQKMEMQQQMAQAKLAPPGGGNGNDAAGTSKTPATQGGRGDVTAPTTRNFLQRLFSRSEPEKKVPARASLDNEFMGLIEEAFSSALDREDSFWLPLIRRTAREVARDTIPVLRSYPDEIITFNYLPFMESVLVGEDSPEWDEEAVMVARARLDRVRELMDQWLESNSWWKINAARFVDRIVGVLTGGFLRGMFDQAESITRSLYEDGLRDTPTLVGINFNLTNEVTLRELDEYAADLVRWVNKGTKYYLKNALIAGVRRGLSSPKIADLIRQGAEIEEILTEPEFEREAIEVVRRTVEGFSKNRANSIVNTEINRAENMGKLGQMKHSGLTLKRWKHLGKRGITKKGNEHPCPICEGNEELGFVPIDYEYDSVFTERDGTHIQTPPGHPQVCHCTVQFDKNDLKAVVGTGNYTPWVGN